MNAVFAVLVYTGLAYSGALEPNNIATTRVDSVSVSDLPPAAQALGALRRGDRITMVNGDSVRTWGDLQLKLANAPPPVTLRVAGRPDSLVLHIAQTDTAARVTMVLALRSQEHTSELQSQSNLVCRLLLEKKKKITIRIHRLVIILY